MPSVARLFALLLLCAGCAQDHATGPEAMLSQIFQEARPEAVTLWRQYCDALTDPGFHGDAHSLPGWKPLTERLLAAASPHFTSELRQAVHGNADDSVTGLLVGIGEQNLRCTYEAGRGLVGMGEGLHDASEFFVRVARDGAGTWRLASWPPMRLEDLLTERERLPARAAFTLNSQPSDSLSDSSPAFQLEWKGKVIAESSEPMLERWRRLDELLQDVVMPSHRRDAQGESQDGVLIRLPAAAPAAILLEVLAQFAKPEHRIPDVQLWVIDGNRSEYLYLDQRGAWGEAPICAPYLVPRGLSVTEALADARARGELEKAGLCFVLPWLGLEPDPVAFLATLENEVVPSCAEFWIALLQEQTSETPDLIGGVETPSLTDPEFVHLFDRVVAQLAPHRSELLPPAELMMQRDHLLRESMQLAFSHIIAFSGILANPDETRWFVRRTMPEPGGAIVALAFRDGFETRASLTTVHLRLEQGSWKFCSWPRGDWQDELPFGFAATPYLPDDNALFVRLWSEAGGHGIAMDREEFFRAGDPRAAAQAFADWLKEHYTTQVLRPFVLRRELAPSTAIAIRASPQASQALLLPLLALTARSDCPRSVLKLQVLLDETRRPGEFLFDQSVTRTEGNTHASTAITLNPHGTMAELCVTADRMIGRGATSLHLLPFAEEVPR